MAGELPEFYFRVRENGATVFRVNTENRQRRIEMSEIAVVNIKNGQVRPHGDHELTEDELAVISDWASERIAVVATRDMDDIYRAVDYLNLTTHWAQTRAEEPAHGIGAQEGGPAGQRRLTASRTGTPPHLLACCAPCLACPAF